mmetsp:Transcript_7091/g.27183  ORF Transcript_7091/g.27183 Transcript_7091/m.27183 type:complete len:240 (+) Transcript_7091:559-1278(+)
MVLWSSFCFRWKRSSSKLIGCTLNRPGRIFVAFRKSWIKPNSPPQKSSDPRPKPFCDGSTTSTKPPEAHCQSRSSTCISGSPPFRAAWRTSVRDDKTSRSTATLDITPRPCELSVLSGKSSSELLHSSLSRLQDAVLSTGPSLEMSLSRGLASDDRLDMEPGVRHGLGLVVVGGGWAGGSAHSRRRSVKSGSASSRSLCDTPKGVSAMEHSSRKTPRASISVWDVRTRRRFPPFFPAWM